ncbi:MAG: alpha/beta hydrolase [Pseudomonadota bacterium]
MPLCQVNIVAGGIEAPHAAEAAVRTASSGLSPDTPAIILIHGYKYSPTLAAHDPHRQILSLDPRPSWKSVSWPRRLGLGAGPGPEPLCVALGWNARGTLWQASTRAAETGAALAELVRLLNDLRPGAPVQILAHSLGARVALSALPHLSAGSVARLILLAAAELRSGAERWLECPAGRAVEVMNVTSRENALFDVLLEWLLAPHHVGDRALGAGLGRALPRWLDLWVDDPATRTALAGLGYEVPAPNRRICHWSVYLRSGLFDLYRAILNDRLSLAEVRAALPQRPARRPRLIGARASLPLPMLRRGAS